MAQDITELCVIIPLIIQSVIHRRFLYKEIKMFPLLLRVAFLLKSVTLKIQEDAVSRALFFQLVTLQNRLNRLVLSLPPFLFTTSYFFFLLYFGKIF